MKIGLIDVDGHNFPNLALMKISAYHKAKGDQVEWCVPLKHYDRVYQRLDLYTSIEFNSTLEEDLYRIYTLRGWGFDPYVMIYDKPNAPRQIRYLQRWCNNKIIFRIEPDFKKYDPRKG